MKGFESDRLTKTISDYFLLNIYYLQIFSKILHLLFKDIWIKRSYRINYFAP